LLSVKAVIALWCGDLAQTKLLLAEAEAELGGELRSGAEVVLWANVQLAVMGGDLDEAAAGYELIWALIHDLGLRAREATVAPGMTRVLLLAGQDEAAIDVGQTLAATRRDCGGVVPIRGHEPAELWVRGLIDRDAGVVGQAARSLGEIGLGVDEALAGLDAVEIAVLRGETNLAVELGVVVAEQLDRLGAKGLRKRLDSLVSVPAVIEPMSALDALSAAEKRVADLVSTGASNPEIAEKLFVSRRTIESHVSHIFTKLGITSRVELAVLVSSDS
jgi:DNA-binding CsgD family transcriptional regulator